MTEKAADQIITIRHSMTGWALYHPADLRSRRKYPKYWWDYDFAIAKEFKRRVLAAAIADFPNYSFAVCRIGSLTEREALLVIDSAEFGLNVRFNQLFFTDLDDLPSDQSHPLVDDVEVQSINIPIGQYRVIVSTIAWMEEPGALDQQGNRNEDALTEYVICFEPVNNFDDVLIIDSVPHLMVNDMPIANRLISRFDEIEIRSPYPFMLLLDQIPLPGVTSYLHIPAEYKSALDAAMMREDWSVVIADADNCPAIGVIFCIESVSDSVTELGYYEVSGIGVKVVELKGLALVGETDWFAEVRLLHSKGSVYEDDHQYFKKPGFFQKIRRFFSSSMQSFDDSDDFFEDPYEKAEKIQMMRELKAKFKDYIQQNREYPYPDFALERVQAISSFSLLTYMIADEIGFSTKDRQALLKILDESARAKMVLRRLNRSVVSE